MTAATMRCFVMVDDGWPRHPERPGFNVISVHAFVRPGQGEPVKVQMELTGEPTMENAASQFEEFARRLRQACQRPAHD